MTEAPEKIWANISIWGDGYPLAGEWNHKDVGRDDDTEYTRTDVALAMVAAAYEDAANSLEERGSDGWAENVMAEYASVMGEAIRARTDADAQAALERVTDDERRNDRHRCRSLWASVHLRKAQHPRARCAGIFRPGKSNRKDRTMTQIKATLIDHMGSDLSVVNSARVSFGKKSEWVYSEVDTNGPHEKALSIKDKKLIRYLAKHKHLSPFGHAFASFHVKAPIFVARQLVKHKFLRWNEISRRYVDDEPEFYSPDVWRGRSEDKKQGSDGEVDLWDVYYQTDSFTPNLEEQVKILTEEQEDTYKALIEAGVAPEQARMVLPQSTMTEWYWSGSLDAFAAMCKLRCASDTQYESRVVANQISEAMGTLFPVSWDALMKGQGDD